MEAALTSPTQAFAPELAARVAMIVATLRTTIGRGFYGKLHLAPFAAPLWRHLGRILRRFETLMALLATGRLPGHRRGPHTGGAPHPENLQRGSPLPRTSGWLLVALGDLAYWAAGCGAQLEKLLEEPAAVEILATVPAAARILRPLRRLLGTGPYDPYLHPRRPSRPTSAALRPPEPAAAPPSPNLLPLGRLIGTSPNGMTFYRLGTPPIRIIRHNI